MDSTNPYKPTTTVDIEDEVVDGSPAIKTPTSKVVVTLGAICMLMGLLEEAFYIMVISGSSSDPDIEDNLSTDHAIPEMSTASAMAMTTAFYMALIARLLYLLLSKRWPEVVSTRKWCWIVSAVVITIHLLLCIWFGLNHDYVPLVVYCGTMCLYTAFCVIIKLKIKIPDYSISNEKKEAMNISEAQPSLG